MLQFSKVGALLLLSAALGACTNSSVTHVKESSLPQSNFTFGEVFEGTTGCKSTDWDHSKAEYDQTLVTFTCVAATPDDLVQASKQESLQVLERVARDKEEHYAKMLAAAQQSLAYAQSDSARADQDRAGKLQIAAQAVHSYEAQAENVARASNGDLRSKRLFEQELYRLRSNYAQLQARQETEWPAEKAREQDAIATSQKRLNEIVQWRDRYLIAVNETKEKTRDELDAHFAGSHKFQLTVTFLAHERKGVKVNSSEWFLNDKKVASNAFMPAFLRHPKDMDTALKDMFSQKISFNSANRYDDRFPIECPMEWGDLVTGCALKR